MGKYDCFGDDVIVYERLRFGVGFVEDLVVDGLVELGELVVGGWSGEDVFGVLSFLDHSSVLTIDQF